MESFIHKSNEIIIQLATKVWSKIFLFFILSYDAKYIKKECFKIIYGRHIINQVEGGIVPVYLN